MQSRILKSEGEFIALPNPCQVEFHLQVLFWTLLDWITILTDLILYPAKGLDENLPMQLLVGFFQQYLFLDFDYVLYRDQIQRLNQQLFLGQFLYGYNIDDGGAYCADEAHSVDEQFLKNLLSVTSYKNHLDYYLQPLIMSTESL